MFDHDYMIREYLGTKHIPPNHELSPTGPPKLKPSFILVINKLLWFLSGFSCRFFLASFSLLLSCFKGMHPLFFLDFCFNLRKISIIFL